MERNAGMIKVTRSRRSCSASSFGYCKVNIYNKESVISHLFYQEVRPVFERMVSTPILTQKLISLLVLLQYKMY